LRGVAFGGVMLASSALNNLFLTYHLNLFITVVHLQPSHFYVAQLIFMVWNASNDVIFGWFSDNLPVAWGSRRSRLPVIRIGGALWALVFLFAWFPWAGLKVGHSGILINSDRNTRFEANSNSSSYKPTWHKSQCWGLKWARGACVGSSLGDSTSIYCFSTLKQQKTEEITPDQRAFLFLVKKKRHERYSRPDRSAIKLAAAAGLEKHVSATQVVNWMAPPRAAAMEA
jgi:hypothetical protein